VSLGVNCFPPNVASNAVGTMTSMLTISELAYGNAKGSLLITLDPDAIGARCGHCLGPWLVARGWIPDSQQRFRFRSFAETTLSTAGIVGRQ
jgi:hypothetical protein